MTQVEAALLERQRTLQGPESLREFTRLEGCRPILHGTRMPIKEERPRRRTWVPKVRAKASVAPGL